MKLARFQESPAFPGQAMLILTAERSAIRKVVVSKVNKKNATLIGNLLSSKCLFFLLLNKYFIELHHLFIVNGYFSPVPNIYDFKS